MAEKQDPFRIVQYHMQNDRHNYTSHALVAGKLAQAGIGKPEDRAKGYQSYEEYAQDCRRNEIMAYREELFNEYMDRLRQSADAA